MHASRHSTRMLVLTAECPGYQETLLILHSSSALGAYTRPPATVVFTRTIRTRKCSSMCDVMCARVCVCGARVYKFNSIALPIGQENSIKLPTHLTHRTKWLLPKMSVTQK